MHKDAGTQVGMATFVVPPRPQNQEKLISNEGHKFQKKNKQKKPINWEFKEKYQLRLISMFCLGLGTSKCVF